MFKAQNAAPSIWPACFIFNYALYVSPLWPCICRGRAWNDCRQLLHEEAETEGHKFPTETGWRPLGLLLPEWRSWQVQDCKMVTKSCVLKSMFFLGWGLRREWNSFSIKDLSRHVNWSQEGCGTDWMEGSASWSTCWRLWERSYWRYRRYGSRRWGTSMKRLKRPDTAESANFANNHVNQCESMWIMPFSDGAMEVPLMPPEVAVVASSANLPPDSSSA